MEEVAGGVVKRKPVGEEGEAVGPLGQKLCDVHRKRRIRAADQRDAAAADFPAVAVGAVEDARAPQFSQARDVGKAVGDAGGDDDVAGSEHLAGRERGAPAAVGGRERVRGGADEGAAEGLELGEAPIAQLHRRNAVHAEDAVGVFAEAIAGLACVDERDPTVGAGERDRCGGAGESAADDGDVGAGVVSVRHAGSSFDGVVWAGPHAAVAIWGRCKRS